MTRYFTPLFPPGAIFHSHENSKSLNFSSVIRSPALGRPLRAVALIQPLVITQVFAGFPPAYDCQPVKSLPLKSSFHPCLISPSVNVFAAGSAAARVNVSKARKIGRAWRSMDEKYSRRSARQRFSSFPDEVRCIHAARD